MAKNPHNGPTFSKASYDHKRRRFDPPSPARKRAEEEQLARDAAESRAFDTKAKKLGLAHALFLGIIPPKEPFKRRF